MEILASIFTEGRFEDRAAAVVALISFYGLFYPITVIVTRHISKNRIRRQIVTSAYKLPLHLSPAELSYIFTSKVNQNHIMATLLDLANRSLIILEKKEGKIVAKLGPRVGNKLAIHEKLLIDRIGEDKSVPLADFTDGLSGVDGLKRETKQYHFWWSLRSNMQRERIINSGMKTVYLKMILSYGLLLSLLICCFSAISITIVRMMRVGEIESGQIFTAVVEIICFWFIILIPILVLSFGLLKMRAKNLGRYWLITDKNKRYLPQIIAFREFVLLTHSNKLKFESPTLKAKAKAETRAYAIALGVDKL